MMLNCYFHVNLSANETFKLLCSCKLSENETLVEITMQKVQTMFLKHSHPLSRLPLYPSSHLQFDENISFYDGASVSKLFRMVHNPRKKPKPDTLIV